MIEALKYFIFPSNLILLFILIGTVLIFIKKTRKWAILFFGIALTNYIIFGSGPISFRLLGGLEYRFSPFDLSKHSKDVEIIVVLAGHAENDPKISLSSRVNNASAFRLIETITIVDKIPNAAIWISGPKEVPEVMKRLLVRMGLDSKQIFIEKKSSSTYESALNLKPWLKSQKFILVTSAGHMPRAMAVFHKQGLTPLPAPTQFLSRKNYLAISYLPSPLHLYYSDLAIHEYLGILWYKLTDKL